MAGPLVQHLPIKKEKCVQRLSVGGRRNLAFIGQHGQESFNLGFTHVARMPHFAAPPVPSDEESDPMQVSFFGLQAIVQIPDTLTHLIQQPRGLQSWCGDSVRADIPIHLSNKVK